MRIFLKQCWTRFREEGRYLLAFGPSWVLLTGFYIWTVYNNGQSLLDNNGGHYGELARAFKLHQLALPVDIDPVLLQAPNPWDTQNLGGHFIWDLSFYKGHYYLYFGATPCLFLFYPWLMMTGQDLGQNLAFVILCSVNLLLFGLLLRVFARYCFPKCPLRWLAALFFVYGIASPTTYLLRLIDMYEIAVASGGVCILFSVYFLFLALYVPRWRWLYFALASFGWGAAVGSRPNFLFGGAFLFFAWLHLAYEQAGPRAVSRSRFLAHTLALALPAAACLVLIGWYNQARFDSPLEFGQQYETNVSDVDRIPVFSTHYFPDRFLAYLFMPPHVYDRFPFIDPSVYKWSWLYVDQTSWEHLTGVFVSFPILLPSLLWVRHVGFYDEARGRRLLEVYGMCLTSAVIGPLLVLLVFCGGSYRYLCDFVPTLYALTAFSLMARRNLAPFARWQTALLVVFLVISAYAGFAYSLIGDTNSIWCYYQNKYNWPLPWQQ